MSRAKMLCFCGADGAGKSTLARLYAVWLRRCGYKVRVAWLRGSHTFASILARFLSRFQVFRGSCNPYYGICVPPRLERLWVWIELFSLLPVLFTHFLLPRALGYAVVGERGPLDFLVWLVVTLRDPSIADSIAGRFVLGLAQRMCFNVYVRAELGVLQARRRGSREEPLLPLQLTVYDAVARACGSSVVDTSGRSVLESFKQVLEIASLGRDKRE